MYKQNELLLQFLFAFDFVLSTAMKYMGTGDPFKALWYHIRDMTPLMGAVITAQYEGAAALIACGARQDLRSFPGAVPVSLFCMLLRVFRI